jgi:TRAP-type mannitol/chloroaromatic compound transport system substrate-binding protein
MLSSLPAQAADFNLRMQSNLGPGQPGYIAIQESFIEGVEKMSGGRVKIKLFPSGALYPVKEGLEAVANGIVEIGMSTGFYFAGKLGKIGSMESGLPGAEHNAVERYGFFYERGFIDVVREAYKKHGVYYLAPNLSSPWELVSKVPLRGKADFKGKKIRGGGIEAEWFKSMGGEGVFIGGSEVYTALATGVVDAVRWGSADQNLAKGFHEVAKYYIKPAPMPAPNNHIIVNQATWDKLPDDIKAIMDFAARQASLNYIAKGEANAAAALAELQKKGMTVVTIPPKEWNEMEQDVRKIWAKYGEDSPLAAKAVKMLNEYLKSLGR